MDLIKKKYTGAQITKDMVRRWKEVKDPTQDDVELLQLQIKILKIIYSEAVANEHHNSVRIYKNKLIDLRRSI